MDPSRGANSFAAAESWFLLGANGFFDAISSNSDSAALAAAGRARST